MKGCGEQIVDVGGLGTFSKKERGMEIIFWQIWKLKFGFRNFVRMTQADSKVLLQMIGCKISSFNVFSLVHILSTCLEGITR
jgi:hypothetical protein